MHGQDHGQIMGQIMPNPPFITSRYLLQVSDAFLESGKKSAWALFKNINSLGSFKLCMTKNFIQLYASMSVWMDVNWVGCDGHSGGRRRSLTVLDFDWLRSYPVASTLGMLLIFQTG